MIGATAFVFSTEVCKSTNRRYKPCLNRKLIVRVPDIWFCYIIILSTGLHHGDRQVLCELIQQ